MVICPQHLEKMKICKSLVLLKAIEGWLEENNGFVKQPQLTIFWLLTESNRKRKCIITCFFISKKTFFSLVILNTDIMQLYLLQVFLFRVRIKVKAHDSLKHFPQKQTRKLELNNCFWPPMTSEAIGGHLSKKALIFQLFKK